jgi:hypothetical protein
MSGLVGHFAVNRFSAQIWNTALLERIDGRAVQELMAKYLKAAKIDPGISALHAEEEP